MVRRLAIVFCLLSASALAQSIGPFPPGATGSAGGDLTGSYPSPTIAKIQGVTINGVTGSSSAVLSTTPTISGGTLTNPTLQDATGVSSLTFSAVNTLQYAHNVAGSLSNLSSNTTAATTSQVRQQLQSSGTPGTASWGNTSSSFTPTGGIAASQTYLQSGANGTGGIQLQAQSASGSIFFAAGGTVTRVTIDSTGAIFAPNLRSTATAQTATVCWNSTIGEITVDTSLGCLTSSERFKHGIRPLSAGLDTVLSLRPVSFFRNVREGSPEASDPNVTKEQVGLIAEQVAAVDEKLISRDEAGLPVGVHYPEMVAVLIKAVQEQQAQIKELQAQANFSIWRRLARAFGWL